MVLIPVRMDLKGVVRNGIEVAALFPRAAGDLFLDKSKRLWFCKGATTWKQIA
jgi:hypothetical protein